MDRAVIPPLGEARHEWQILSDIGDAMGLPFMNNPLLDRVRKVSKLFGRPLSAAGVADLMIRTGPRGDRFCRGATAYRSRRSAPILTVAATGESYRRTSGEDSPPRRQSASCGTSTSSATSLDCARTQPAR